MYSRFLSLYVVGTHLSAATCINQTYRRILFTTRPPLGHGSFNNPFDELLHLPVSGRSNEINFSVDGRCVPTLAKRESRTTFRRVSITSLTIIRGYFKINTSIWFFFIKREQLSLTCRWCSCLIKKKKIKCLFFWSLHIHFEIFARSFQRNAGDDYIRGMRLRKSRVHEESESSTGDV